MKWMALFAIVVSLLVCGCASASYDDGSKRQHSDMPWNTPASWEGSVGVPGFSDYR